MDLIAQEAGVARQTIYNRFKNKDALFEAAMKQHWQALSDALAIDLDPDEEPSIVLRRAALHVISFIDDNDQVAVTRMVVSESREAPRLAEDFYRLGKMPLLQRLTEYLSAAKLRGFLSVRDTHLAAQQFLGMVQEPLFWPRVIGLDVPSERDAATVIDEAVSVFVAAYAPAR
ncbi:MAG: TetR/AcrR family transcriptional regulator [Parasphingorhabdus sp.]